MIALKIISLLLWLIAVPFFMGRLLAGWLHIEERKICFSWIGGYLMQFALFELLGIPVVILVTYHGFTILTILFAVCSLLLAGGGVFCCFKKNKRMSGNDSRSLMEGKKQALKKENVIELLFYLPVVLLIGFQLYMAFTRASFDGDDAYYGAQGLIALQQDTLYRINPYTGRSAPLDVRHALALMPIWEAFLGKVSGIHMTIIAHSIVPLVLIPLTDLLYFQIGKKLLKGREKSLPMFMLIIVLFQIFGNVSIQTAETFLLTRTWQGKSLSGNFMIPAVFWYFLCILENTLKEKERRYFTLLAVTNLAAGISSSLAVLLTCALTAGLSFLTTLQKRKLSYVLFGVLACLPGAVYILVYLFIS